MNAMLSYLIDAFMPVFYVFLAAALIFGVAVYLGRND